MLRSTLLLLLLFASTLSCCTEEHHPRSFTPSDSTVSSCLVKGSTEWEGFRRIWQSLQFKGMQSPVTDSESEAVNITQHMEIDAVSYDEWLLPAAYGSDLHENVGSCSVEPQSDEPISGESSRRVCSLCKDMDATRGITEGVGGKWKTFLCRTCSQFVKGSISLSTRCYSCSRYANFGPVGGIRRDARHCKRHRRSDEVNLSKRPTRAELADLSRTGSWESSMQELDSLCDVLEREGEPPFANSRISKSRRCSFPNCEFAASFGLSGTSATLCGIHRLADHVDVIHRRRCEVEGCVRHPSYGHPSESFARFCKSHRPQNFIDMKSRKCQYPFGCLKRPSFGSAEDGIPRFCMQHKLRTHVNVKSRKCQSAGCGKQPCFGSNVDHVVRFCAIHRGKDDVDLVHRSPAVTLQPAVSESELQQEPSPSREAPRLVDLALPPNPQEQRFTIVDFVR